MITRIRFFKLGIDFMIEDNRDSENMHLDDNLDIKLIEVNTVPGFGFNNKHNDHRFLKSLFQELDKHIFSKILGNFNKTTR